METGSKRRVCIKISRRCSEGEQILKGNVCWNERDNNKDKKRYIKDKLIANVRIYLFNYKIKIKWNFKRYICNNNNNIFLFKQKFKK